MTSHVRAVKTLIGAACFAVVLIVPGRLRDQSDTASPAGTSPLLASEPEVLDASSLWLVPSPRDQARRLSPERAQFVKAVELYSQGKYADALPLFKPEAFAGSELAPYVHYYKGLTEVALASYDAAAATFATIVGTQPVGYLSEAAPLGQAETLEAAGEYAGAARIYESLSQQKTRAPDEVLLRLARVSMALGDRERATETYSRVYYEFPLGEAGAAASVELKKLDVQPIARGNARYTAELALGERLFGAKRYAEAKRSFQLVRPFAAGDDRELVDLRLAESDCYLQRYRAAAQTLRPYVTGARRTAEALFFYLSALRALGDHDNYVALSRQLVAQFPASPWAEETLNNLGSHYIRVDDDERAAEVFAELYEKYPNSRYGDRAAWKAGWWAFKLGRYEEAIRLFTDAAARFPQSDSRSAFQYWTARAYEKAGRTADARSAFGTVAQNYGRSYYGRLAAAKSPAASVVLASAHAAVEIDPGTPPPSAALIRDLLSLKLHNAAIDELTYAQHIWGTTPLIDATLGWVYNQEGDLRRGINAMKRAYPTYLSAAGALLPREVLEVLFPLDHWDLIRKHSAARDLDPYMIAALMAQESTFTADIKSSAGAIGLMQIMPATGRQLARTLKIPRYRTSMLTRPEINVRMGTLYFANLTKRFGGAHFALASYNAGDHRVARWLAERPGLEQDEFIDDIPFPETQNYVKKILGTAEDYRTIYGAQGSSRRFGRGFLNEGSDGGS
ncbi:MAG: transglycosylase SLT domain-containing protein [Acidobacteria bacterium]|nr:transglycosylase SLT domain-containing protein [Acidobacteriota bacterium]